MVGSMKKVAVLIRCVRPSARLFDLAKQLKELDQSKEVKYEFFAVPDRLSQGNKEDDRIFETNGLTPLPLTTEFLESSRLHYYEEKERTGWACGDYVIYRALENEWDYAWVVEPDVYFLNNSHLLIQKWDGLPQGLLGTHIWPAAGNWMWRKQLQWFLPEEQVYAMGFPLLRISRSNAEKCLELRQFITQNMPDNARIPNDESIVATVSHRSGEGVLDLKQCHPEIFKYWSTAMRYPVADLRETESTPLIVHSGFEHREFLQHLMDLWHSLDEGWEKGRIKLLEAFRVASPKTKQTFMEHISFEKLNKAKDSS